MKAKLLSVLLLSMFVVNCAKKSSDPAPAATTPTIYDPTAPYVDVGTGPYSPPSTGPGMGPGPGFFYGGTTDFAFDGTGVYEDYTQRNIGSIAELSNVKVNLNLQRYANNTYGGTLTIRYAYQGQTYEGFFTSGHDSFSNKYNVWMGAPGNKEWHGFFEDFMGGVIVVIDDATQLADGVHSTDTLSGSVYFRNFRVQPWYGAHPPVYCWFVSSGPYDCRSWPENGKVDTYQSVYPTAAYTRLGTFTGMPATKAFENLGL